jgi:CheY-like chemotaxis protein
MTQTASDAHRQPRVLLIEDESLVSMLIEDMLADLGYEVVEVVSRMDTALRATEDVTFDFAMVDVNLAGQPTYPIADRLAASGIPFVFVTGYGVEGLDPAYAATPVLSKPFRSEELAQVISQLLQVG